MKNEGGGQNWYIKTKREQLVIHDLYSKSKAKVELLPWGRIYDCVGAPVAPNGLYSMVAGSAAGAAMNAAVIMLGLPWLLAATVAAKFIVFKFFIDILNGNVSEDSQSMVP
jgi:hypothetical protein